MPTLDDATADAPDDAAAEPAVAPETPPVPVVSSPDEVDVVYVGIHDEVFIPSHNDLVCTRGTVVTVPASVAGRSPSGVRGDADFDPGEGLLAQVDNWALAGSQAHKDAPPPLDSVLNDQP